MTVTTAPSMFDWIRLAREMDRFTAHYGSGLAGIWHYVWKGDYYAARTAFDKYSAVVIEQGHGFTRRCPICLREPA